VPRAIRIAKAGIEATDHFSMKITIELKSMLISTTTTGLASGWFCSDRLAPKEGMAFSV